MSLIQIRKSFYFKKSKEFYEKFLMELEVGSAKKSLEYLRESLTYKKACN